MAYQKQTWQDSEVITKEKLNHIEEGIANIELTPGPKGETGAQGPAVVTAFNNLIADLKAKGYMNES